MPLRGVLTGTATVNGSRPSGWRGRGDLTLDDARRALARRSAAAQWDAASKRIVADARLAPLALATVNELVPGARLRGTVTGRVRAEGTTRDLRLAAALRSARVAARSTLRGTLALRGKRTRYDLVAVADALDASAFTARAPSTSLTGTIAARGSGLLAGDGERRGAGRSHELALRHLRRRSVAHAAGRRERARPGGHADRAGARCARGRRRHARARGGPGRHAAILRRGRLASPCCARGSARATRAWSPAPAARRHAALVAARADSARRADALRIERLALGLPEGVELAPDTLPPLRRDSLAGSLDRVRHAVRQREAARRERARRRARGSWRAAPPCGRSRPTSPERRAATAARRSASACEPTAWRRAGARSSGSTPRDGGATAPSPATCACARTRSCRTPRSARMRGRRAGRARRAARLAARDVRHARVASRASGNGAARARIGRDRLDRPAQLRRRAAVRVRARAEGQARCRWTWRRSACASRRCCARCSATPTATACSARTAHLSGTRMRPVVDGRATLRDARWLGTRAPDADVTIDYRDRRAALAGGGARQQRAARAVGHRVAAVRPRARRASAGRAGSRGRSRRTS